MKRCSNCGAKIKKGQAFCENCGNMVDEEQLNDNQLDSNEYEYQNDYIDGNEGNEEDSDDFQEENNVGTQVAQDIDNIINYNVGNRSGKHYRYEYDKYGNLRRKRTGVFGKIILWIFFLPVMLTIKICKTPKITNRNKAIYSIIVWVLFIVLIIVSSCSSGDKKDSNVSSTYSKSKITTSKSIANGKSSKKPKFKDIDKWVETGKTEDSVLIHIKNDKGLDIEEIINSTTVESTNENVAKAKINQSSNEHYNKNKNRNYAIHVDISIVGKGKTDIFVKSKDGEIISDKVHLSVGNEYNPKKFVNEHCKKHVKSKLKYEKISEKLFEERSGRYYSKTRDDYYNKSIYNYHVHSGVRITNTNIEGNTATVKGIAYTFNENMYPCECKFTIKVSYNKEITDIKIVSEKYDLPEVIKQ